MKMSKMSYTFSKSSVHFFLSVVGFYIYKTDGFEVIFCTKRSNIERNVSALQFKTSKLNRKIKDLIKENKLKIKIDEK